MTDVDNSSPNEEPIITDQAPIETPGEQTTTSGADLIGSGTDPEPQQEAVAPQPIPETEKTPITPKIETFDPEIMVDGKTVYTVDTHPSEALVLHCGDPRFQTAFRTFLTRELGLKNYTPIIIGGGVHAFGLQSFLPKNFKILWEQVKFFVKEQSLSRVIIINHDDCKWYERMRGYHSRIKTADKGKHDLTTAALTILRDFSGITVSTYWADLEGDRITFREIVDRA